jgi:hypothetical protein
VLREHASISGKIATHKDLGYILDVHTIPSSLEALTKIHQVRRSLQHSMECASLLRSGGKHPYFLQDATSRYYYTLVSALFQATDLRDHSLTLPLTMSVPFVVGFQTALNTKSYVRGCTISNASRKPNPGTRYLGILEPHPSFDIKLVLDYRNAEVIGMRAKTWGRVLAL